jgi:hypothetical protein
MNETQVAVVLAAVFGYAQQWLRGFKQYNDGWTLFVSVALAVLGAFWIAPAAVEWKALTWSAAGIFLQIMGGTGIGHMAAQANTPVMLAPKYNSFGGGSK